MSDDIEVIEDTIPKLEAFYSSYNELSTEVDGLLEKIASFSVSAISSDGLESKSQELQGLEEAVSQRRSKLEDILASCELLETPFDHSKFEKNVSDLQEKMALCDKVHYHCLQPQRGAYNTQQYSFTDYHCIPSTRRQLLIRRRTSRHLVKRCSLWKTSFVSSRPGWTAVRTR